MLGAQKKTHRKRWAKSKFFAEHGGDKHIMLHRDKNVHKAPSS